MIMLVGLPRILRYRPLEIQSLIRLHIMQMLAHRPIRIPLDHQINVALRILIADRRVWPYDRFLHLRPLVFRNQRGRDLQARDIILVRQREAEFLRVVVELLDGLELQVDEALVATGERGGLGGGSAGGEVRRDGLALLGGWGRGGLGGRGALVVVVSSAS